LWEETGEPGDQKQRGAEEKTEEEELDEVHEAILSERPTSYPPGYKTGLKRIGRSINGM
jgi:hypothetical protein